MENKKLTGKKRGIIIIPKKKRVSRKILDTLYQNIDSTIILNPSNPDYRVG